MHLREDEFQALLSALRAEDPRARQEAAIALSQVRDARAIAPLLAALEDEDATVRVNAAAGLGLNRAGEALGPLLAHLRSDAHELVRERAATALAQIGDASVIEPLIDALDDPSTWVRNRVIYVLGASRDARAVEPLVLLLDHREPSTQSVAAWALGSIGDGRAAEPLLELLRDGNASVRGNAAWALGELGDARAIDALIRLLKDREPEVRGKAAWALGMLGEASGRVEMVKPLIDALDDFSEVKGRAAHIFVAQYAAEALTQIGSEVALLAVEAWKPRARERLEPYRLKDLIEALGHLDAQRHEAAAEELVTLGAAAVPALSAALQNVRNLRQRQQAARVLGLIGDARAVKPLLAALEDRDAGVWSQATGALARIPDAAEVLRHALHHASQRTRYGAAIALWRQTRSEEAFQPLLAAMLDEELLVRSSAITSLWQQPDERALATLQIVLAQEHDAQSMLARYALQALQAIGTPGAWVTIQHWLAEHHP